MASTISVLADKVKYSTFYLSYFNKEYNVLIENDLDGYASVSFDVDNMEYGEYALVKIYINRIDQFIQSLNQAKSKYIEWSAIAKDSGRVCFMKIFPYSCNSPNKTYILLVRDAILVRTGWVFMHSSLWMQKEILI